MKHFILLKFCTEVLIIISKNSSKFCERLIDKQCHSDVITELAGLISHTNLVQRYNLLFLTKLQNFVEID